MPEIDTLHDILTASEGYQKHQLLSLLKQYCNTPPIYAVALPDAGCLIKTETSVAKADNKDCARAMTAERFLELSHLKELGAAALCEGLPLFIVKSWETKPPPALIKPICVA